MSILEQNSGRARVPVRHHDGVRALARTRAERLENTGAERDGREPDEPHPAGVQISASVSRVFGPISLASSIEPKSPRAALSAARSV